MDLKLKDKIAIVTGSTAGIGFAIASQLARENATVIINGRTQQGVSEAVSKIKSDYPQAKLKEVVADLGQAEGADKLIKMIPEADILVNNVGIFEMKPFEEITDEEWLTMFNVNVMSGVRLSRHYFPLMKKKNWGRIIFISSESAVQTPSEMIHYGMTKTAQLAIARGLAELTVGTEVTVNSVLPGPTWSRGVETFVEVIARERNLKVDSIEKEFFANVRPSSLLKRFIQPSEVADLVAFVASPLSAAVNGAALRVEGGVIRGVV